MIPGSSPSSRSKKNDDRSHEMELTPMIDVTFLLLLFFLCTLQFKTLEGKLQAFLPHDAGTNTTNEVPPETVEIRIDVVEAGDDDLVGRKLAYTVGPRRTHSLGRVASWLRELHAQDPERRFALHPRTATVYDDVIPVLDVMVIAGITDIRFAGETR